MTVIVRLSRSVITSVTGLSVSLFGVGCCAAGAASRSSRRAMRARHSFFVSGEERPGAGDHLGVRADEPLASLGALDDEVRCLEHGHVLSAPRRTTSRIRRRGSRRTAPARSSGAGCRAGPTSPMRGNTRSTSASLSSCTTILVVHYGEADAVSRVSLGNPFRCMFTSLTPERRKGRSAVSTSLRSGYHHGDLRATLLSTAMRMLEDGEQFSLRAVAREAGVSPTAPDRHFTDRDALESALATRVCEN